MMNEVESYSCEKCNRSNALVANLSGENQHLKLILRKQKEKSLDTTHVLNLFLESQKVIKKLKSELSVCNEKLEAFSLENKKPGRKSVDYDNTLDVDALQKSIPGTMHNHHHLSQKNISSPPNSPPYNNEIENYKNKLLCIQNYNMQLQSEIDSLSRVKISYEKDKKLLDKLSNEMKEKDYFIECLNEKIKIYEEKLNISDGIQSMPSLFCQSSFERKEREEEPSVLSPESPFKFQELESLFSFSDEEATQNEGITGPNPDPTFLEENVPMALESKIPELALRSLSSSITLTDSQTQTEWMASICSDICQFSSQTDIIKEKTISLDQITTQKEILEGQLAQLHAKNTCLIEKLNDLETNSELEISELNDKISESLSEISSLKTELQNSKNTNRTHFEKITALETLLDCTSSDLSQKSQQTTELLQTLQCLSKENKALEDKFEKTQAPLAASQQNTQTSYDKDICKTYYQDSMDKLQEIQLKTNELVDFHKKILHLQKPEYNPPTVCSPPPPLVLQSPNSVRSKKRLRLTKNELENEPTTTTTRSPRKNSQRTLLKIINSLQTHSWTYFKILFENISILNIPQLDPNILLTHLDSFEGSHFIKAFQEFVLSSTVEQSLIEPPPLTASQTLEEEKFLELFKSIIKEPSNGSDDSSSFIRELLDCLARWTLSPTTTTGGLEFDWPQNQKLIRLYCLLCKNILKCSAKVIVFLIDAWFSHRLSFVNKIFFTCIIAQVWPQIVELTPNGSSSSPPLFLLTMRTITLDLIQNSDESSHQSLFKLLSFLSNWSLSSRHPTSEEPLLLDEFIKDIITQILSSNRENILSLNQNGIALSSKSFQGISCVYLIALYQGWLWTYEKVIVSFIWPLIGSLGQRLKENILYKEASLGGDSSLQEDSQLIFLILVMAKLSEVGWRALETTDGPSSAITSTILIIKEKFETLLKCCVSGSIYFSIFVQICILETFLKYSPSFSSLNSHDKRRFFSESAFLQNFQIHLIKTFSKFNVHNILRKTIFILF